MNLYQEFCHLAEWVHQQPHATSYQPILLLLASRGFFHEDKNTRAAFLHRFSHEYSLPLVRQVNQYETLKVRVATSIQNAFVDQLEKKYPLLLALQQKHIQFDVIASKSPREETLILYPNYQPLIVDKEVVADVKTSTTKTKPTDSTATSMCCIHFPCTLLAADMTRHSLLVSLYEDVPRLVCYRDLATPNNGMVYDAEHTEPIVDVNILQESKNVVSISLDKTAKVWKQDANESLLTATFAMPLYTLSIHTFLPLMLVAGESTTIYGYSLEKHVVQTYKSNSALAHQRDICQVNWIPHSASLFVSTSLDKTAKVWDIRTGHPVQTLYGIPHPTSALTVSSSLESASAYVSLGTCKGNVLTYSLHKPQVALQNDILFGHPYVSAMEYTPSGELLVGHTNKMTRYASGTYTSKETLESEQKQLRIISIETFGTNDMVSCIGYNMD
jgi:hypothetical protein